MIKETMQTIQLVKVALHLGQHRLESFKRWPTSSAHEFHLWLTWWQQCLCASPLIGLIEVTQLNIWVTDLRATSEAPAVQHCITRWPQFCSSYMALIQHVWGRRRLTKKLETRNP